MYKSIKQRSSNRWQRVGLTLSATSLVLLVSATACQAMTEQRSFDAATGRFAPCPDSPNCVSTQAPADDAEHAMAPLPYTGTAAAAKEQLLEIIEEMPRTTIVANETTAGGEYLHVEFRSFFFRFVDDVEFFINEGTQTIEFRSASRLGYSDLGVNRKRMEAIGARFQQQGA